MSSSVAAAPRSRSPSAGAPDEEEVELQLGDEIVAEPPSSSIKVDTAPETKSPEQRSISIVGSGKRAEVEEKEKIQVPPSKRPRLAGADATRQKRLFGVLTKTLSRFNEDTKKETEASKRRAAVEERLAAKLQEEKEAHEAKAGKEKARRNLKYDIMKKEDEKNAFIAVVSCFCGIDHRNYASAESDLSSTRDCRSRPERQRKRDWQTSSAQNILQPKLRRAIQAVCLPRHILHFHTLLRPRLANQQLLNLCTTCLRSYSRGRPTKSMPRLKTCEQNSRRRKKAGRRS